MTTSNHAITADGLQRANVIVTARFDVALGQVPAGVQSAMDARVVMEFSPGLQADGDDATFALETGTNNVKQVSDLSYEAGVFNIGQTLDGVEFQMTLPVRVTAGASSTGRLCVTATIEAQPFTGIGQFRDDATDNAAKECWGPAPAGELQVLVSGTADLFTWYDCVGKSAPPCDRKDDGDATTNDDLQLVAFVGAAAEDFGIFQPSQVVVHIPDPGGRAEGKTGGLVWSTGFENWGSCQGLNPNCLPGDRDRPGVIIARNTAWLDLESTNDDDRWGTPHTNTAFAAYETGYLKVSASAPASGKMTAYRLRSSDRATLLLWSTSADGVKHEATAEILARTPEVGYSSADTGLMWVEFTKLGTYEMTLRVKADYETNVNDTMGGNNPTPPTNHEDEATYTFHVGPLADLSVASGASPHVAADRNALTIVAANNGPDNTADAEVKIALPSGALVEDHVASDGTYSNGVWTLTGLQSRDYRRSSGKPEAATLTLILKDGGVPKEPAGGTIRLTDNSYNVCIDSKRNTLAHETQADCKADAKTTDTWHSAVCVQDSDQTVNTLATHDTQAECEALTGHTWTANVCASSASKVIANRTEAECDGWHTGTVYDPPANNTAKITAVKGTDIGAWPADLRFAATPLLTWEAVPHVNDWPVHRYQVQYQNGDNWQDLAEVPGDQTYFADSDARSKPSYRVRALNEAGVPGFWSRAASQVTYRQALPPSPPLNVTAVAGHAGEVVVSWELPVDDGGSPITYYQVQWSRSGTGGWSNACRSEGPSDLSCTQTGIPAGETRYYRVAAYAGGLGDWSDLAVATTIPGVPSAPRGLSASRAPQDLGGETILAIRLNWSAPATDNGSPIYAYAVEYVDYDQSAGRCGTDWQYLGGDPGIHSNDPPTRQFLDTGEYEWIGLEPGAHRCYRVSAINSAGEGPFSNVARASAGGAVPPEWVYLDGEADGQNAITLYWAEPYYDGGAPVTGYQLQHSSDGESWSNLASTGASVWYYTHTGRKVNEPWHYRIRARNSAGWSEWSYPIAVTIQEGTTANIAQPSLTARATSSTEVLLSWNSLCNHNKEGDCENKRINGYMVEYSEDGGFYGWERLTWVWTDQTKVVDSTVEPGATRYYRVAGYQEEGGRQLPGRWSQLKSVTTADFVVGAPQNLTITAEGERGLKLVWDEVTEGRDAASITGYRIERNAWSGDGTEEFDTSWVARQSNRKSNTYVETGLAPGTDYYYRVAAVTRNGSVPWIGPYSELERFFIPPPGG